MAGRMASVDQGMSKVSRRRVFGKEKPRPLRDGVRGITGGWRLKPAMSPYALPTPGSGQGAGGWVRSSWFTYRHGRRGR